MDSTQDSTLPSVSLAGGASVSVSTPSAPILPSAPLAPHPTQIDAAIHERLLRDYKRLKVRVGVLEKENEGLRASLWELSWRWGKRESNHKAKQQQQQQQQQHQQQQQETVNESRSRDMTPKPSMAAVGPSSTPEEGPASIPPTTSEGSFMRLKEPVHQSPTPNTSTLTWRSPSRPPLPSTPSSLAASLFPTPPSTSASSKPPTEIGLGSGGGSSSVSSKTTTTTTTAAAVTIAIAAHAPPTTSPAMRDASLKRDLDISLPHSRSYSSHSSRRTRQSWKWGRAYDLKAHRGAVYALKFSDGDWGNRGRVLASAAFDGVRLWGSKDEIGAAGTRSGEAFDAEHDGDADPDGDGEQGNGWDDGDVQEITHLSSHTAPVSDIAFQPSMQHVLSGGYDSRLFVHPLGGSPSPSTPDSPLQTPTSPLPLHRSSSFAPIWSLTTEGLVQSVDWLHPHAAQGSESEQVFVWGTSGKVLGVGDLRMDKPAMVVMCDAMINSVQSFRRSPNLLIGDSFGSIRHFSLRASTFLPFPETNSTSPSANSTGSKVSSGKKGTSSISCLALAPDWYGGGGHGGKGREPRWMASVGFDNFIRIYDRSSHFDPLKQALTPPKLIQTLRGKNRNWPIKVSFFQGKEYSDIVSTIGKSKRGGAGSTGRRSRAASFSGSSAGRMGGLGHGHGLDEEEEEDRRRREGDEEGSGEKGKKGSSGGGMGGGQKTEEEDSRPRPLDESLLIAVGSSDPVVLIYDLTGPVPSSGSSTNESGSTTTSTTMESGRLAQRLEGHKDSVYAVDWLQPRYGEPDRGSYQGHGLLASAGGDWVVKVWKPVFKDEDE
ncbi:BQ5605_C018g08583 [Microbotryum silenes-dioicae]|uniref:BQ5605_C018g08583 protein n=1 Tax=Microbotryum silenes-dioicae TaxID=796604 RepID=A0A2X0LWH8_9BASI|nr:BQ5605_C018g08583 [Microbotryum silenes-dioicae]